MNAGKLKKKLVYWRNRVFAEKQQPEHYTQCPWCEIAGGCLCKRKFSVAQNARLNGGMWK